MAKKVSQSDTRAKRIAAVVLILFLVGCVVLSLALFVRAFDRTVPLTVVSERAGLVLDKDAAVRSRGVEIGRVTDITQELGGAVLHLKVDPDALVAIPANSPVTIGSNTVFGAKTVDFGVPDEPAGDSLRRGATIRSAEVTTEVNSLFEKLTELLQAVEPEKLNATIGALATALDGRGDRLGTMLVDLDTYLKTVNPQIETLQRDLVKGSKVAGLYGDVTPDVLRTLSAGTDVGNNVVAHQSRFEALLTATIGTGESGKILLDANGDQLIKAVRDLRASTSLLAEYAPSTSCMIIGLNRGVEENARAFGGANQAGLVFKAGFAQGAKPYEYPTDLPKVNASTGPRCYGLPFPDPNVHPGFAVTDTGSNPVEGMPGVFTKDQGPLFGPLPPPQPGKPAPPTLLQLMLGARPGGGA